MLNELPCLKWKSPLGVLTVPHFVNIWTLCCCPSQCDAPALALHKAGHWGHLPFCHVKTSRTAPAFPSILLPYNPTVGSLASCAPVLSNLPCPYNPPSQKMILAPLTTRTTSLMAESDPEHLEGTTGKGRWGDKGWWQSLSSCGRSEALLWRWRKPLQSWICETYWEMAGSWGKRFHNLPREDKPEGWQHFQPLPGWKECLCTLDSNLPSSTHGIFQAERVVESHMGVHSFPLQPHLGRTHQGSLATAVPTSSAGQRCSSPTPAPGGHCGAWGLQQLLMLMLLEHQQLHNLSPDPTLAVSVLTCFPSLLNFAC